MDGLSDDLLGLLRQLQNGEPPFDGETCIDPGSKVDRLLKEAQFHGLIAKVTPTDGLEWQVEFALTKEGARILQS